MFIRPRKRLVLRLSDLTTSASSLPSNNCNVTTILVKFDTNELRFKFEFTDKYRA
jgi:hypothetical protein